MEHIVDQHQVTVVHVERQLRGANLRIDADPAEVVAVEGNIQPAERRGDAKPLVQAFGDPDAAGVHPTSAGSAILRRTSRSSCPAITSIRNSASRTMRGSVVG